MADSAAGNSNSTAVRTELNGTEGKVVLAGEIDHGVAPQLDAAMAELIESGAKRLVVDFANLSFFDSACLSALVRAHSAVQERGGEVKLVNVDRFAHRILQIAGLLPLFDITMADGADSAGSSGS
ncbi:STAS domain-containing protein [Amycolatopsis suaedae]|uniref:Anti-sigma factor antagonist n=1 Tax=Amycolatopsis suaedae TaxID=2510978 RepID=A0A4Q7IZM5_9PSEU|nr:STAS domain-containing protein [Amycolatopsis suaedae]RZQ60511.1 anti-sigma factor antagonist [Amycolatopsis suaedae]